MKRLLLFIGLLLTLSNLSAQKKINRSIKTQGVKDVFVHVKFADDIEVKNWNKNEISVQATVSINDNKDNDYFQLKEEKNGNSYHIKSDYGDFFSNHKKGVTITQRGEDCNSYNYCSNHNKLEINYVIYVPNGMKLKIKSISGNVNTLAYNGTLTLDLISGNINIKKHSNNMNLKTISGEIDVVVSDAELKAETITGTVYSDLEIKFNNNAKKQVGNKIYGTVKNGTASLKLKTISGDIFLRKRKS